MRRPPLLLVLGLLGPLLAALLVACDSGAEVVDAPGPGSSTDAGDGWVRLPDAPLSARSRSLVEAVGDRVVVVGGWELLCPPTADCAFPEEPLHADGAVLNTRTDEWSPMAPAPFGLVGEQRQTAALGGSVFTVTGCRTGMGCAGAPELLEYDVAADRWHEHGRVPGFRSSYVALVPVGDRLVVHRASDEQGRPADLVFDPGAGSWDRLPADPLPEVYDRFAVAVGDDLVLAGSPTAALDDGGVPDTKLLARLDLETGTWTRLPDAPGPGYQLWAAGDELLLNGHYRPVWLLDPETGRWREGPSVEGDRGVDVYGAVDGDRSTYELYSVGSLGSDGRARLYNVGTGDLLTVAAPPGREDAYDDTSTAVGSSLFVFGGQEWTGSREGTLLHDAWLWTPPEG
ncbi:hypothetical protein [Nocardioides sp. Soil805]|uniref:hypothetical protein n=1 Tax=Nocardioides sp. Soil805 TaxID=1736416 RepID=UPI000702B96F|nr:hypothetical protein [Nocardioides sp. Soil805]KRF36132.1 hypothetical protein ASG94_01195 [Nocardioides sp. Soil805]